MISAIFKIYSFLRLPIRLITAVIAILFFALTLILLNSCATKKITQESRNIIKDSIIVDRVLSTRDTIFISVPSVRTETPECDTIVKREVVHVLKNINFKKQGEQIDIGIFYDSINKHIVAYTALKEQYNQLKNKHLKSQFNEKIEQENTSENIRKITQNVFYTVLLWALIALIVFSVHRIVKI